MGNRKKIILLCASLSNGGAERVVSILSQELSKDFEILLYLLDGSKVTYHYKGEIADLQYTKIFETVKRWVPIPHINTLITLACLILKVRRLKRRHNPYCCISFLETPNIINLLSSIHERIIVSVRSTRSIQRNTLYERLENWFIPFYKHAYRIVACSDGVKHDLVSKFKLPENRIQTIYNPYFPEFIKKKMVEKLESKYIDFFIHHKTITIVGRLIKQKKQDRILNSLTRLRSKIPELGIVIIGSGEQECNLKEIAKSQHIEEHVVFIPFDKNPYRYIYQSSLFLSTSEREGFPNNIIEAMICGTPVIAVDCESGPREIIADKHYYGDDIRSAEIYDKGILIPKEKYDDKNSVLVDVICQCLNSPKMLDNITSGVASFLEMVSVNKISKKWKDIIEE